MRFSLLFILLIPALIALGHDFYLFYVHFAEPRGFSIDLLMQEFKLSALGFIWTNYEPESYKQTVSAMSPEDWAVIDSILTWKVVYVMLGFAGAVMTMILTLKLFKGTLSLGIKKQPTKAQVSFRAGAGSKKMEYKRK